ncbi:hypothetical protein [Wenjunlia vitaminophila]|uniref:hypothetical protein n=1 Tax=Wenjunlia vitaminophila TaxID=76728 RepID=UPI00035DE35A|nr:hypothetical protein [Wenjunlia vitaminophila]
MTALDPPVCRHWIGVEGRRCGVTEGVRRFLNSVACPAHTPAALDGRPEPPPRPGYTPQAIPSPLSDSRVVDNRAIASGKRRSSTHVYRAAQDAVHHTYERTTP